MSDSTRTKTTLKCTGCYNDEYNHGLGGSKECWSFNSAKVIKRLCIGVNQTPPFSEKNATWYMSCYQRPGNCYIDPKDLTKDGYWK